MDFEIETNCSFFCSIFSLVLYTQFPIIIINNFLFGSLNKSFQSYILFEEQIIENINFFTIANV